MALGPTRQHFPRLAAAAQYRTRPVPSANDSERMDYLCPKHLTLLPSRSNILRHRSCTLDLHRSAHAGFASVLHISLPGTEVRGDVESDQPSALPSRQGRRRGSRTRVQDWSCSNDGELENGKHCQQKKVRYREQERS